MVRKVRKTTQGGRIGTKITEHCVYNFGLGTDWKDSAVTTAMLWQFDTAAAPKVVPVGQAGVVTELNFKSHATVLQLSWEFALPHHQFLPRWDTQPSPILVVAGCMCQASDSYTPQIGSSSR